MKIKFLTAILAIFSLGIHSSTAMSFSLWDFFCGNDLENIDKGEVLVSTPKNFEKDLISDVKKLTKFNEFSRELLIDFEKAEKVDHYIEYLSDLMKISINIDDVENGSYDRLSSFIHTFVNYSKTYYRSLIDQYRPGKEWGADEFIVVRGYLFSKVIASSNPEIVSQVWTIRDMHLNDELDGMENIDGGVSKHMVDMFFLPFID